MAARSSVGASSTCTSRANETSPTFASFGSPLIMMRAAVRAAAIRLGLTSVAAIEFDVSTARTTVVSFWSLGSHRLRPGDADEQQAERQQQQRGRHVTAPAGTARHQVRPQRRVRGGARLPAAAPGEDDVRDDGQRHDDEQGEQVRIGERHVVLRSAQEEPAAASSRSAAAPATTNVTSFCSLVELTRVPMRS